MASKGRKRRSEGRRGGSEGRRGGSEGRRDNGHRPRQAGRRSAGREQDHLSRRARSEGFAARSVYKLDELQRRLSLVKPGDAVLDLGAAPGSWSARLLELTGGQVVSIDLQSIDRIERAGRRATILQGDFTGDETVEKLVELGPFDVVLSDAAPATTGNRALDTARSAELVESAIALCERVLKQGGNAAFKLFQGGDEQRILADMRERFETAKQLKPKASRDESFEVFLVGLGYRG